MSLPPLPFTPLPVARLERPTMEELRSRMHDGPLVATGLLDGSPLLEELRAASSMEQKLKGLQGYFGDEKVAYDVLSPESKGHYGAVYGPELQVISDAPFAAFAERLGRSEATGEYVYLRAHGVSPESRLRTGIRLDFLNFAARQDVLTKVWIGSHGQVAELHYDDFINFICMLDGSKRVTMFSPELLSDLYLGPFDWLCGGAPASYVKLLDPDFEKFPRFRNALRSAYSTVIEPGEVLLIPPLWWHHVESFGFTAMLNNWILSVPLKSSAEQWRSLTRAIRLLAPRSPEQRAQAREVFARAVFAADAPAPSAVPAWLEEPVRSTRELVRTLPPFWRAHLARMYDEFAFQVNGVPFPSEPGVFEALLERTRQSTSLYPAVDFIDPPPAP